MKDWVIVYSSNQLYKVEYIQSLLNENDIESVILNKQDSSYIIGDIDLYVHFENTIKAKLIISENETE